MNEEPDMESNLWHQLRQREMGMAPNGNPHAFRAQLYRERYRMAKNLFHTDLRAHFGCVNAIEFSHGGKFLASGGDDKRVLVWDVEKAIADIEQPRIFETEHSSNIFCLGFDSQNRHVFSGGNDDLVIKHNFETGKLSNVFKHDNPVYGLSIDPKSDNIFATACEDGQILLFDMRVDPGDPVSIAQQQTSFHAVEFHPSSGNFLVTANSKTGAAFWDIRKPHHPVIQYGHTEDPPSCMSVRFNATGNLILALRRRLPPILYGANSPDPICTFYHSNYYNSCTMKSCCFAGEDDEFVLSGSDDFNLYVWRVSDVDLDRNDQWVETTQMILYGHRSIVNQVRYNRQKCLLASSGVEKIVKLWSPFDQNGWKGSLTDEANSAENARELYSPYNFSSSSQPHTWSLISHDYSSHNTNEDPRMMAFFDSLIQQEIEGWETNSTTDSTLGSDSSRSLASAIDDGSSSSDDDNDDDDRQNPGNVATPTTNRPRRILRRDCNIRALVLSKARAQRQRFNNRIAYLIAMKRNTLRRLAIKGASSSRRRPHKIIKVKQLFRRNGVQSSAKAANGRSSSMPCSSTSSAVASTSTGAASTSAYRSNNAMPRSRAQRTYDSSSDESDDTKDTPTAVQNGRSRQSPSNALNNAPIPSTSTGITSNVKESLMRLQRQILDSDEDDDDDDDDFSSTLATARLHIEEPPARPTRKLNGARRTNEESAEAQPMFTANRMVTRGFSALHNSQLSFLPQPTRSRSRPRLSAALKIPAKARAEALALRSSAAAASPTRSFSATTTLPQANANRRRPHADETVTNTADLNTRLQTDEQTSSSSDDHATPCKPSNTETSPHKRRKLALASYINTRTESPDELEENNNEQNNNNIFPTTSSVSNDSNGMQHKPEEVQATPIKPEQQTSHHQSTPDSGISVRTHPGFSSDDSARRNGNNDDDVASTSSGRLRTPARTPNPNGHKTAINLFQQKVARVRRNYRKKFAESDSD